MRLPGRIDAAETAFASTSDLASAMRRAWAAHGEHAKRIGAADPDWPDGDAAVHGGGAGGRGTAAASDNDVVAFDIPTLPVAVSRVSARSTAHRGAGTRSGPSAT